MSQVRFIAVARIADKVPVAEYAHVNTADFPKSLYEDKFSRVLASSRIQEHGRLTITDNDVGCIHYDSDPSCLYLVITSRDYPQRKAFQLLAETKARFEAEFANDFNFAKPSGLSKKAQKLFSEIAHKYDAAAKADKVAHVALQVEQVKGVMQNNINAALKNQENLNSLMESTANMKTEASTFQRSTVRAKNRFWWQNVKLMIAISVLVLVLVLLITIPLVSHHTAKEST